MSADKHYEIERKYLIRWIDPEFLRNQAGCAVWTIEQIYLTAEPGQTRRIRQVTENGEPRWYKTFKRRLTALSCEEDEGRISLEEFSRLRAEADPDKKPIQKVRYRIPWQGQTLEFDLYPFWTDRAILEVELEREDQSVFLPDWVRVVRDVTADRRYKNVRLASEIPMDSLSED